MPKIRQKINRKKDCFLEYKRFDFNYILMDSPYMTIHIKRKIIGTKKESRNMTEYKNYHPSILDIKFYLHDEDGNELENKDGTTKEFRFKEGIRFKPLEYLCEDLTTETLEEIK